MARLLWRSWPCYQICYPTTANPMLFTFADQELTYQFWCQREAVLPVMVASSNIAWTSNHLETASWFHKQIGLKWNVPWKLRFSKHGTNIIEIDIFIFYMDTTFLNSPKAAKNSGARGGILAKKYVTSYRRWTFRRQPKWKQNTTSLRHFYVINIQPTPPQEWIIFMHRWLFVSFCRKNNLRCRVVHVACVLPLPLMFFDHAKSSCIAGVSGE